jgi:hypothetical protein
MADVTQNISAQLFVKELPAAQRADFNGCKQDFNAMHFTTCDNYTESDNAVENAFQQQLSLSEYYKSPYVFETLKQNYMAKTMDSHFETAEVNLAPSPKTMPPEVSTGTPNVTVGSRDLIQNGIKDSGIFKESFGAMSGGKSHILFIIALFVIVFYCCKK